MNKHIFILICVMLLLVPATLAKDKIKIDKGDATDELNSFFYVSLKLDNMKLKENDFNVLYVYFFGDTALIRFENDGKRYWYMTDKIKIK